MERKYFIGIDFGHGETTVSRVPGYNGEPVSQVALRATRRGEKKTIPSAICKKGGEWSLVYGVDDYKESPKFVIQLAKKDFHTLPGSGKSGWYLDSFGGKWMEKGLSNNLSDMIAIAQKFQHEMESLCTSD